MSLTLKYIDAPEGVQETMVLSGQGGSPFTRVQSLAAGVADTPWATLEPGVWRLDGTRVPQHSDSNPGWWSEAASGPDGSFPEPPTVTLTLPAPCSATGLTFTFSPSTGQWCSRLRVSWYNGSQVLLVGEYAPDGPRWTLQQTVESFDKLRLELLQTSAPHQFAKLQRLEIGQTIEFDATEILSVQLVNETDPSLCVLSADTMTLELIDRKNRGLIPQENQRLELYRDGKIKAVQYMVSGTREGKNLYTLKCQSAVGLLEETFLGGLYRAVPLQELAQQILDPWPFLLEPCFRDVTVTGYLPVCTQREALQRLAFAVGAIITTQDSSCIRFLPLSTAVKGTFTHSQIFQGATLRTEPRVARVEVTAHSFTPTQEEVTLLRDEEILGEDVLITFDNPHHSYTLTGGTLSDWGDNWVKLTADGPVTLTAKNYLHTTRVHARRNSAAIARELGNYLAVSDDTLIHSGNVDAALERLYAFARLRQTLEQDAVITGQTCGSFVSSLSPWGTQVRGFIASMDLTLTQTGAVARLRIPGEEIGLEQERFYSGRLRSGDWEVMP